MIFYILAGLVMTIGGIMAHNMLCSVLGFAGAGMFFNIAFVESKFTPYCDYNKTFWHEMLAVLWLAWGIYIATRRSYGLYISWWILSMSCVAVFSGLITNTRPFTLIGYIGCVAAYVAYRTAFRVFDISKLLTCITAAIASIAVINGKTKTLSIISAVTGISSIIISVAYAVSSALPLQSDFFSIVLQGLSSQFNVVVSLLLVLSVLLMGTAVMNKHSKKY